MSGCTTCGGFGNRHDPIAHGVEVLSKWWLCSSDEFDEVCPNCFDTWPLHVYPCTEASKCTCEHYVPEWGPHDKNCPEATP